MDNSTAVANATGPAEATKSRRLRRSGTEVKLRYFLPADDSSGRTLKLGQEVASEGDALIQAFKSGQPFYTVAIWKAVPEVNGSGNPMIVKQALLRD